jgi:hypothetical protein
MYRGMQRQRRSSSWLCGSLPATSLLARNRLTRTAAGRRFVLSGECAPGGGCGQRASLLARNRLTRTAAGRRFVLFGECVPGGGCGRAAFVVALTTFLGLANRLRVRVRRVSAR